MNEKTVRICHLYPDLLNLYGDRGNLAALEKRLSWRGFEVETILCKEKEELPDFGEVDLIILGGGSDREQEKVLRLLSAKKEELKQYVEGDGVLLATCGGFDMLGKSYVTTTGTVEGLGILNSYTEDASQRFVGNIVLEREGISDPVVGFENHIGKTMIDGYLPLGSVLAGKGNLGDSTGEGLRYKNVFATHLHGPLLPKNPQLCDEILTAMLQRREENFAGLVPLDDSTEKQANQEIVTRILQG